MAIKTLSLSSPALLAEYVHQSDLTGFFEQRLVAPPDHVAILVRNGELVDAYKGANFSIGGLFAGLRSKLTGSMHVRVLLADLKPFSLQSAFRAITKDKVEVAGVVTFELQLDPEKPLNIMGLVSPIGQLTREEILERFRPHLSDRVFEAVIGRVKAEELRGNTGLQDKLQGDVMREIERVAGDLGLIVRSVSVEWALSDAERDALKAAELDRQEEMLDGDLDRLRRRLERAAEATTVEVRTNVDLSKLKLESDDEVARLALTKEIEFIDTREAAQRRQELEALEHEIETLTKERLGRFENEQAEAGQRIDLARYGRALARVELEIDGMKQAHLAEMAKLGAFTESEIEERRRMLELDISERASRQSRAHIEELARIEREGERHSVELEETSKEGDTRREIAKTRAEADSRLAMMKAAAGMTPEQILAINAGFSPAVAEVLAEQARAGASGREETMAVMREMVQQASEARVSSEEQAREMFRMGMDGAARVAHGAGGKGQEPAGISASSAPTAATVECPTCGRENSAKAKFCVGCGGRLRV